MANWKLFNHQVKKMIITPIQKAGYPQRLLMK